MRIHLIKERTVIVYANGLGDKGAAFFSWLAVIKEADVTKPGDFQQLFNHTDLLGKGSHLEIQRRVGSCLC